MIETSSWHDLALFVPQGFSGKDGLNHPVQILPGPSSPLTTTFSDVDYSLRRMSSSSASADSDASKHRSSSSSPHPDHGRSDAALSDHLAYPAQREQDVKPQLPSIYSTLGESLPADVRRSSLPAIHPDASRVTRPYLTHRGSSTSLNGYQFPNAPETAHDARPRLNADTQLPIDSHYQTGSPYATPSSTSSYTSHGMLYSATDPQSASWQTGVISRPSSNPAEFSPRQPSMYGSAARISGQDRRFSSTSTATDYTLSPEMAQVGSPYHPSLASSVPGDGGSGSGTNTPIVPPPPSPPSLVERAPRKRGKLPKHVTDFLKEWLHRHQDHPYPSEEEKKQLCHHTGLSMSQVSNWMINARRRILAPAQRAAQGLTNRPYDNRGGTAHIVDTMPRRQSMPPISGSMQLYPPGSVPSMYGPSLGGQPGYPMPLSMPRSAHPSYGGEYAGSRLPYGGQSGGHLQHSSYLPSGMPMTAPTSTSTMNYSPSLGGQSSMAGLYAPSPSQMNYRYPPPSQPATPPTHGTDGSSGAQHALQPAAARYYSGTQQTGSPQTAAAGYTATP